MNFLTTFNALRKYFWIILVIAIIILLLLLQREKQKTEDFSLLSRLNQREVEVWKDKAGKNRMRAQTAEINSKNIKLVLDSELKKTIQKEVGNLRRNLISYTSIGSNTSGTFRTSSIDTVYVLPDSSQLTSLPAKKFSLVEPDLSFNGIYIPSLDSLVADYSISHNFEVFHYYRRPGKGLFKFLRRKEAVAEIKFDNENTSGDSLYSIVLERKGWLWRLFGR